ncbi:hypothetical protein [Aeromicrobium sp. 9AM]|uniref:hypothetical protein n=1 Tax=Aeromicrobium sp. 9AM TaxID=2653126 RepID=UPI0012EFE2DC|nr:hypothetical protein [Aeromicrobium sp. 9AM]VXC15574.1 conserved hypothetical protein [Aeromicrobium sp. 9AM]
MAANGKRTVGLFDIRFIIGGLIGLYGVILTFLGVFNASDKELAKGDGLNINLWAGLGMLVVGVAFMAWARLRPVIVPDDAESTDAP